MSSLQVYLITTNQIKKKQTKKVSSGKQQENYLKDSVILV